MFNDAVLLLVVVIGAATGNFWVVALAAVGTLFVRIATQPPSRDEEDERL